jgi:hypothetical protein
LLAALASQTAVNEHVVIPAKGGIQTGVSYWIPAFAGMTKNLPSLWFMVTNVPPDSPSRQRRLFSGR